MALRVPPPGTLARDHAPLAVSLAIALAAAITAWYYSRCFTLSADGSSLRGRAWRFRDEPVRTDVTVSDGDRVMSRDEEQELR